MQFAKDSFYMALRDRLAAVNPARTVAVNGMIRPAVLVAENETPTESAPATDAFFLSWGTVAIAKGWERATRPLLAMECRISYGTAGASDAANDRGRALAALDMELLSMCSPAHTAKQDWTQTPSRDLGGSVFWTGLRMGDATASVQRGWTLSRVAELTVLFFPEVDLP